MLIFIDSNGKVVGTTPLGITQGSSKANTLQLVCPFPNAIVSVSFQLPNGIVLGPYLEDDYGTPANEYVMHKAFDIPGYGVEGSTLTVYTYTCNKEISALPGNLGVQFFVHVGEIVAGEGADEYGGYTLAVPMINVPVYNGTKFIPAPEIPEVNTWSGILELLTALRTGIEQTGSDLSNLESNAVLKNPVFPNQTINSNIILGTGKALRADEVAATNASMGKAEIINGGDLVFSDIGTKFKVSPILDEGVIVGLRIPGKVEASHIKSTSGDIGNIYTEFGIDIDANYGNIYFYGDGGVGGESKPVSYGISANIKHDDEWDQDYVAGLAFYGEDDFFYGTLTFDRPPKCEEPPEEAEDLTTKGYVDRAIYNLTVGGVATFNDDVYIYGTLRGQSAELTDAYIDGTLVIAGDLTVNGKTTAVNHETLIIKDNIIVTNSDGLNITASGLVINKGNGKAYGILYQPQGDLVYIGEGTYSVSGGIPYFDFDAGQALPLAARSENFPNGEIPIFDAATASFKPSGKTMDGLQGQIDSITAQISGVEETLAEINDGGIV